MDSRDDKTVLIDSKEVLEKMKREALRNSKKMHDLREEEESRSKVDFLDEEDANSEDEFFDSEEEESEFYDEEDNEDEFYDEEDADDDGFYDEEDTDDDGFYDEEDVEDEDDLRFVDDDFDYDVFRYDRARKQREVEKEDLDQTIRLQLNELGVASSENNKEEMADDSDSAEDVATEEPETTDGSERTDTAEADDNVEDPAETDASEDGENTDASSDLEEVEEDEEVDEDATQYLDPEHVKEVRVSGFEVSTEENDPTADADQENGNDAENSAESGEEDSEVQEDGSEEKKPGKAGKIIKGILLTLLGLVVVAYAAGCGYFYTHFGPNSVVNDVDVSYMNTKQVQDIIEEQVQNYSLTVQERNDETEVIKGSDVDLTYVRDNQVSKILHAQNCLIWPYRVIADVKAEEQFTHASVQMNEDKFKDVVKNLNCSDEEKMIAPANAYASLEGSVYAAHPEEEGTTIKPDVLRTVLSEALLSTAATVDLSENGCYTEPEIRSDDPEIKKICDKKNEVIGLSITYHFGDETDVLDGATTDAWFTWDEDLNPTLDESKIEEWAVEFGKKHDTIGKERTFTGAAGREVTVSGGTYGWSVDEEAEIEMVKQMFAEKKSQDREPIWATEAASHDANDWGNTYIEVDIATQHMWYFRDGEVIFENDVVTGLPTAGRSTTPGVWSILEMMRGKTLRGAKLEDGSYEYETPVAYWMRVTWTGIGFHDATWQPSFGGNRYTYAGSHGCINMSYSGAQQLYDIAYVGLPVIVHQ